MEGLLAGCQIKKKTDQVKLLWDFRIQTDQILDPSRLEVVVLKKEGKAWVLPCCWCSLPFRYTGSRKKEREDATTIETRGIYAPSLGRVCNNMSFLVTKSLQSCRKARGGYKEEKHERACAQHVTYTERKNAIYTSKLQFVNKNSCLCIWIRLKGPHCFAMLVER